MVLQLGMLLFVVGTALLFPLICSASADINASGEPEFSEKTKYLTIAFIASWGLASICMLLFLR